MYAEICQFEILGRQHICRGARGAASWAFKQVARVARLVQTVLSQSSKHLEAVAYIPENVPAYIPENVGDSCSDDDSLSSGPPRLDDTTDDDTE